MRFRWHGAVCLFTAALLPAQRVITTVAGTDWVFPRSSLPALEAPAGLPTGLVFDASTGGLILLDNLNHTAFRLSADGRLSVLAGNGLGGYSGDDGSAINASLLYPRSCTLDRSGNLYIADSEGRALRVVSADGKIRTLSGGGRRAPADGVPIAEAQFSSIISIAALPGGELAIADDVLQRLFRVSANGVLTRIAGNGTCRSDGDGANARSANVCLPDHLAADLEGNLYFSDVVDTQSTPRARRVRRISASGVIEAFAGSGSSARVRPGVPAVESPMQPYALTVDARGRLLISSGIAATRPDEEVTDIARVGADGRIETIPAPELSRFLVTELAAAGDGTVYATSSLPGRVFRIRAGGGAEQIAGNGRFRFGGDGGEGNLALLNIPLGLALDPQGNLFIADVGNNRIRRLDANGIISTVAGNGERLLSPPEPGSPATASPVVQPFLMAMGPGERPYFSSSFGLHRLNGDGTQTVEPYSAVNPGGLAFDAGGSLVYADRGRGRLLRGRPNSPGLFALDTVIPGSLRDGTLTAPFDVAADQRGNVYVSEWSAHRVLRIDSNGTLSTFAGTGRLSSAPIPPGPRPATSVALTQPSGLAIDGQGNLLVRSHGHVSRVTPEGELEVIAGIGPSTLGSVVFGDGGPAAESALGATGDLAVDAAGNIFLSEVDNHRVRKILAEPPGFRVSTDSIELDAVSGGAISAARTLVATGEIAGLGFSATTRTVSGGEWLRVSAPSGVTPRAIEVSADPSKLAPGVYSGSVDFAVPLGLPRSVTVPVRLDVSAPRPAVLEVDTDALTFTYPKTASRRERTVLVTNTGSGMIPVQVSATGGFVEVSPMSGIVTATQPLLLTIAADPDGRPPGLYKGTVTVRGGDMSRLIGVTMTISDREQAILLSQNGLSFQAVAGGGVAPPQTFSVLNIGNGAMPWRTSVSTLAGGSGWLTASEREGVTHAGSKDVPLIEVHVNQAGLAPGVYHGLIEVHSGTAANSPHSLPVFLEVLPPDARPGSVVQPSTLTFTGAQGEPVGSQELTVFNLARDPIVYRSSAPLFAPGQPLQYAPIDASVSASDPSRIVVQPQTRLLPPGVYRSDLSLQFADGTVRRVEIHVVIRPAGASKAAGRAAEACAAKRLIPTLESLGQAASVPTGWPAGVVVKVNDDCGAPLEEGSVTVSFSNGDPPLQLQSLHNGRWHGTWTSRSGQAGNVTVRVSAENAALKLEGQHESTADLRAAEQPPTIEESGVLNAPLAPGGLMTLSGERLTVNQTLTAPPQSALPGRLGETEVLIGGRRAPLFAASANRIQALVPFDVNPNTRHQILVRRGASYSRAIGVNVATAQPAIESTPDGNAAVAFAIRGGGDPAPITSRDPARAGDRILLSCFGLGAVGDSSFTAGQLSPVTALKVIAPVTVRIGGVAVPTVEATLAPGRVGAYWAGFDLPASAAPGDRVEVVVESQGQISPPAALAIQQESK